MNEITLVLNRLANGDTLAAQELLPKIYDELRAMAAWQMSQEKPGQTLQATALVHEAYLRLVDREQAQQWDNRRHFYAAAAQAMRRILVENARRRSRAKHGGELCRMPLNDMADETAVSPASLLALNDALEKLAAEDPQVAELVQLRFFSGLNNNELARALEISPATVTRRWRFARAWLSRELGGQETGC